MHATIFRKKGTGNKMCVLILFEKFVSGTFYILQGIQQDIIINVHRYSQNVPIILIRF